jgi:hypothetical protein
MKNLIQQPVQPSFKFTLSLSALFMLGMGCGDSDHTLATYNGLDGGRTNDSLPTGGAGSAGNGGSEEASGGAGGAETSGSAGNTGGTGGAETSGGSGGYSSSSGNQDAAIPDAPTARVDVAVANPDAAMDAPSGLSDAWRVDTDSAVDAPAKPSDTATADTARSTQDLGSTSSDGPPACSVTNAVFTVVPGSVLDSYCFPACGLPLRLYKDGTAVNLYDYSHPTCGTCEPPISPMCTRNGLPVTGYSFALSRRYDVAGKCSGQDCSTATCLEAGAYKVSYTIYAKQTDGTCGGQPVEVSAEFDYPKTTEVNLRFSTLASCSTNADCTTDQVCYRGPSSSHCISSALLCTALGPPYTDCSCPDCMCSGGASPDSYLACVP